MNILAIAVNVLAIFVAGIGGSMLRTRIPRSCKRVMAQGCGLLALGIGAWGIIRQLTDVTAPRPEIEGTVLVLCAAVVGTLIGYGLLTQKTLVTLGDKCRHFFADEMNQKDKHKQAKNHRSETMGASSLPEDIPPIHTGDSFTDGFLLATMVVCSGSLLALGLLQNSLTVLYIKAGVDAVLIFVLAMIYGDGVSLSAIPLLITNGFLYAAHQGGRSLLSSLLLTIKVDGWESANGKEITETKLAEFTETVEETVATWNTEVIAQVAMLAAILMIAVGVVMAAEKKYKIAHMLPSYAALYIFQCFVSLLTAAIKG